MAGPLSWSRAAKRDAVVTSCLAWGDASGQWVVYRDESATRLVADPAVGLADTEEKDYAWGDVDLDGDTDLVVARKQPFSTAGGRRNVLLLNMNGVLTDETAAMIAGFLDATNDRDVKLVDVNNDTSRKSMMPTSPSPSVRLGPQSRPPVGLQRRRHRGHQRFPGAACELGTVRLIRGRRMRGPVIVRRVSAAFFVRNSGPYGGRTSMCKHHRIRRPHALARPSVASSLP